MERYNALQGTHKGIIEENSTLRISIDTAADRVKQLEAANKKAKAELTAYSEL